MTRIFKLLSPAFLFLAIVSCEDFESNDNLEVRGLSEFLVEEAYPGEIGELEVIKTSVEPFEYRRINGEAVFEGDIILSKEQLEILEGKKSGRAQSTGRASLAARWPGRIVYYTISPSLPNQHRVTDAIAHWESNTDISFIPRTTEPNYISFIPGDGCASFVGMIGGEQYVWLGGGCTTGNTIHEIGHAVGLFHEHSRSNRNSNVRVNWENILSGYEHNFRTYNVLGFSGFDSDVFDFGSIMLYPSDAFSSNGQPTLVNNAGGTFTTQRNELSPGDIAGVTQLYNAVELARPSNVYAYHDGKSELEVTWDAVPGATRYYIITDYRTAGEFELYKIELSNIYVRELKLIFRDQYRLFISAADDNGNVSRAVEPGYSWK